MIRILKEKVQDFKFFIKIAKYNQPIEFNIALILLFPGCFSYFYLLCHYPEKISSKALVMSLSICTVTFFLFLGVAFLEAVMFKKRINKYYISVPTLFSRKCCYLNIKKPKNKLKKNQCPKLMSLLDMRHIELKEGKTYIACTHDGIINFLKENIKYEIEFLHEPKFLETKSLHKIVKSLRTKKCKQCEKDCNDNKNQGNKVCDWIKKEDRNFYGIKFKIHEK